jgi:hypothetical protein
MKVKADNIQRLWFKYNTLKELCRELGYSDHGALTARAKKLGLPDWSKRVSWLYINRCIRD